MDKETAKHISILRNHADNLECDDCPATAKEVRAAVAHFESHIDFLNKVIGKKNKRVTKMEDAFAKIHDAVEGRWDGAE